MKTWSNGCSMAAHWVAQGPNSEFPRLRRVFIIASLNTNEVLQFGSLSEKGRFGERKGVTKDQCYHLPPCRTGRSSQMLNQRAVDAWLLESMSKEPYSSHFGKKMCTTRKLHWLKVFVCTGTNWILKGIDSKVSQILALVMSSYTSNFFNGIIFN